VAGTVLEWSIGSTNIPPATKGTDVSESRVPHHVGGSRWAGSPGRLEVWYATFTDRATGAGGWIHCETVAPTRTAAGAPYAHGWLSWFPVDGPPSTHRFGPVPASPRGRRDEVADDAWFDAAGCRVGPDVLSGAAGGARWDLRWTDGGRTLYTFPKPAWERELLPAAQIVVAPTAEFTGRLVLPAPDGGTTGVDVAGPGGLAHIYGQGNALRWAWLHADLGDGDVVEVVTAVSKKPLLRRLPPTCFVRFRLDGTDWPAPGLPAFRLRSTLGLPDWSVRGRVGRRRVAIHVHQPPDRTVALAYTDPDGETATCTNTERADVTVVLETRAGGRWTTERSWELTGTGHAEVGTRP